MLSSEGFTRQTDISVCVTLHSHVCVTLCTQPCCQRTVCCHCFTFRLQPQPVVAPVEPTPTVVLPTTVQVPVPCDGKWVEQPATCNAPCEGTGTQTAIFQVILLLAVVLGSWKARYPSIQKHAVSVRHLLICVFFPQPTIPAGLYLLGSHSHTPCVY
jgi:hypothetical protein